MESIDWLSEKGIDFDRSVVEIPVGALWRRAHKPKRPKGVELSTNYQNASKNKTVASLLTHVQRI